MLHAWTLSSDWHGGGWGGGGGLLFMYQTPCLADIPAQSTAPPVVVLQVPINTALQPALQVLLQQNQQGGGSCMHSSEAWLCHSPVRVFRASPEWPLLLAQNSCTSALRALFVVGAASFLHHTAAARSSSTVACRTGDNRQLTGQLVS
jgi:hypothetical protein